MKYNQLRLPLRLPLRPPLRDPLLIPQRLPRQAPLKALLKALLRAPLRALLKAPPRAPLRNHQSVKIVLTWSHANVPTGKGEWERKNSSANVTQKRSSRLSVKEVVEFAHHANA